MKNKYIRRRIVFCLIVLFLLFFIIFLVINKSSNNKEQTVNYKYENRVKTLEKFDTNDIPKYGWLQVQGTNIDLPIISDLFTGTPDYNYGWLVSNSIGYDTRKVLSGHNVLNVSTTPMVNDERLSDFEPLMSFVYYDFAKDNMYLVYTEDGVDKVYVIYAVGFYDYFYEYDLTGLNKDQVLDYVKYVKKNSIYDYGIDVKEDDEIITLKTCTRMFGVNEKQEFQIDARLVRKNEKTVKHNISKTELYEKYNLKDSYKKS